MSERSEYAPGEFCWVDLATPDLEAAKGFYGDLLGVGFEEAPGGAEATGGYGFLTKSGKQVCGVGPTMGEGQPPAWHSYVKVESADDTAAAVKDAGGTVAFEPMDLPNDSGRMAVCQDPTGAFFSIMQQKQHSGAQIVNEPGCWTWNHLVTNDTDAALDFYDKVFGWSGVHNEEAPEGMFMVQSEGQRWPEGMAGMMQMGDDVPAGVPPHWQVYFVVDELDAATKSIEAAGGRHMFGPQEIPVGKIGGYLDPQGAAFCLIEPDYPEPR